MFKAQRLQIVRIWTLAKKELSNVSLNLLTSGKMDHNGTHSLLNEIKLTNKGNLSQAPLVSIGHKMTKSQKRFDDEKSTIFGC